MADANTAMRRRLDLTEVTEPSNRRLDSLAKLLATGSGSICVAVAIIDGKLVVASNEFYSKTKSRESNKKKEKIELMLEFFAKVARDNPVLPDERKKLFLDICRGCKSATTEPVYATKLGEEKFKILVDYVFNQSDPAISEFKKIFKEQYKIAWAAYAEMRSLLQALNRVEEGLHQQTSEPSANDQFIRACSEKYRLLQTEPKQGVHAEVQILADLVYNVVSKSTTDVNQEIYIGISKLCCLECRVMLEESTEPLQERYSTILKFRGHHDLSFDDNWIVPHFFSQGYNAEKDVVGTDLMFQIGKNAKIRVDELSLINMIRVNQSPLPTASNPSPVRMEVGFSEQSVAHLLQESLEKAHEKLRESGYPEQVIDQKILMVLDLLKIDIFRDMLHGDDVIGNRNTEFESILAQLNQMRTNISNHELLQILKNSKLVGTNIAEHFAPMNLGISREMLQDDPSGLRARLMDVVAEAQGLSHTASDIENIHDEGAPITHLGEKRQAEDTAAQTAAKRVKGDPGASTSKNIEHSPVPRPSSPSQ